MKGDYLIKYFSAIVSVLDKNRLAEKNLNKRRKHLRLHEAKEDADLLQGIVNQLYLGG